MTYDNGGTACDAIADAVNSLPRADRRSFLRTLGSTAATGGIAAAAGCSTAASGPSPAAAAAPGATLTMIGDPDARTRLVLLGTSGGPPMTSAERSGTSTAIVVGDRCYLIDLGWGANPITKAEQVCRRASISAHPDCR